MQKEVTAGIILIVVVLIVGCTQIPQNQNISVQDPSLEQDQKHIQDSQRIQFENVKGEIDYWYTQPPRSIGSLHKQQMMDRLNAVNISQAEKDPYIQKLNSILLVDDPAYVQEQRQQEQPSQEQSQLPQYISPITCEGTGTVQFTHPPMNIDEIEKIEPIGLMIGGHVTPIDHGYYTGKGWTTSSREDLSLYRNVFAPAAGKIQVGQMPSEYASSSVGDYRLVLYHTCSFYTIYIHVNQLSEKLQKIVGTNEAVDVQAGELIGKAPGFDFSVHNENITLPGFIVPKTYEVEPFKLHTVDMFDNFVEPLRTQLLAKNVRQAAPRGGKIDYDIDGKLVGNWFEENTNGYRGKPEYNSGIGYWGTHVAFAYDGYVPSTLVLSIGDFDGQAQQFGVKGNSPDFATVSQDTGLVTYELVKYEYLTDAGEYWTRTHFAKLMSTEPSTVIEGTVLVQMLEDRKIKLETFPGQSTSQVEGFTSGAKIYVR